MTGHTYKPGDVAKLTFDNGSTAIGVRCASGDSWAHSGRWAGGAAFDRVGGFEARPIVVLDPEDREQVERLLAGYYAEPWETVRASSIDNMQRALRSLTEPPTLDEPQGLGAVVETSNGDLYVRSKTITTVAHWKPAKGGIRRKWADLRVVRVLSEGVQP